MGDIKDDANFQMTVADNNASTGDVKDNPNIPMGVAPSGSEIQNFLQCEIESQSVPIIGKGSYYYT